MNYIDIIAKCSLSQLDTIIEVGKAYKLYAFVTNADIMQQGSQGFKLDNRVLFYKKSNIRDIGIVFRTNEELEIPNTSDLVKFYLVQQL